MNIAVVGVGAVGLCWAKAVVGQGLGELSLADPVPGASSLAWARGHQLPIHAEPRDAVAGADVVLICVPGHLLPAVADAVLTSTTAGAVVVDLSTAAAVAKQEASVLAERAGVHYVDAAITGAVALSGVRTPLLYAGERFAVVDNLFAALETPVVYLSDSRPGDAVRVKLLRSVIMKGLEALAVDALPAARQYGLLDQLFAVLSDVDQRPFADLLRSMVVTHPGQAERRKAEVAEAAAQLDEVGVAADLTGSVAGRFGRTVDRIAVAGLPGYATLEATLDWFDDAASSNRALVGRGVQG